MVGKSSLRISAALAVTVLMSACVTQAETTTTGAVDGTSTITAGTTQPSPTSTTTPAPTTTSGSSVIDEAAGSGCTPGAGRFPDGEWFGYVASTTATTVEFDLACWFTGDAAVRAAAEDGEESPPPNDYYVRNIEERLRELEVAATAEVVWYPSIGDPTSETTIVYPEWIEGVEERVLTLGVWLEVEGGVVVSIREQWVP